MANKLDPLSVWQMLRSDEPHLLIRMGVSVAAAALFLGVCMLGVAAVLLYYRQYNGDCALALAVFLASVAWYVVLRRIWRGARANPTLLAPALCTLAMTGVLGAVCYVAANLVRYDEGYVVAALVLCGVGAVILAWLAPLARIMRGKALIGPDGQVAVHCPECGYSLVGLRDLRCPECGARFTIDQLIRTQGYGATSASKTTIRIAKSSGGALGQRSAPD